MNKRGSRILKGAEIRIEGRVQLGLDSVPPEVRQSAGPQGGARAAARVLESTAQFAVVEITCGCGARTYVRCDYADAASTENSIADGTDETAATNPPSEQT
jgi:hypothetical protein